MSVVQKLLVPIAWFYGSFLWLRNVAYDLKMIRIYRAKIPVISVGNMTVGGTGKTPFIEYLLVHYSAQNINACVISRGYKRTTSGLQVVSDGKRIFGNALEYGDEPLQIAKKFPHSIVVVDEDRSRAVDYVTKRFNPALILLDDGFQHRSLGRNVDIVMIDGRKNLVKTPMLPAGRRREPLSALQRADLLVFTQVTSSSNDILASLKKYATAPSVGVRRQAKQFHSLANDRTASIDIFRNAPCVAFCGVGNPQGFKTTLAEIGVNILDFLIYPDHHIYSGAELANIRRHFELHKAQYLVTTEKDAMRLQSLNKNLDFPWDLCYFLEIEMTMVAGESILRYVLKEKIDRYLD